MNAAASDPMQSVDLCFLDPGARLLPPFGSARDAVRWAGHLGRGVTRTPRDLARHARRVLALRAARDAEGLYGALLDLFIALGPRGFDLRRGLLAQSKPLLAADAAAFLEAHLEHGITATTPHPPTPASRLTGALRGTLDCLAPVPATAPSAAERDALADALELLAQGEVDAPRILLEGALANGPAAVEVLTLLLEIYRRGRYAAAFAALQARQPALATIAPAIWAETAKHLGVAPLRSGVDTR